MPKAWGGSDDVVKELSGIKRLLILMLLKSGATQGEIGGALGIDQSRVSRIFAGIKVKRKK